MVYKWNGARQAVTIAEDMKLSQFDLVDCPAGNMTDYIGQNSKLALCKYFSVCLSVIIAL